MRAVSEKKAWIATMAILAAVGWALLHSPWAEWAPVGARWPSMVVAFLFGQTAFLTFSYYPLLVAAFLVPVAFGMPPGQRSYLKNPFFLNGAVFLVGFAGVFALQSMAILPIRAHGTGGNLLTEQLAAGLLIFAGLVSIFLSLRQNPAPMNSRNVYRISLKALILFLGIGWGVYYGHDLDPTYDRIFFRVGAGPGSHEAPALILFGVGLLGLQALWTRGAELWLGNVLARRGVRLGAGAALALRGLLMMGGLHPF
ncbi:hypothetical protein ACFLQ0_01765 [Nitrospinota bacterium]